METYDEFKDDKLTVKAGLSLLEVANDLFVGKHFSLVSFYFL